MNVTDFPVRPTIRLSFRDLHQVGQGDDGHSVGFVRHKGKIACRRKGNGRRKEHGCGNDSTVEHTRSRKRESACRNFRGI